MPSLTTDLVLAEGDRAFDANLARLMQMKSERIVVDIGSPTPRGETPALLTGWVKAVEASNGSVTETVISCTQTRGVVRFLKWVWRSVAGPPAAVDVYAPAKDYEVVLYFDANAQLIRQAVFRRRIPQ